jgi:hypothetical protein
VRGEGLCLLAREGPAAGPTVLREGEPERGGSEIAPAGEGALLRGYRGPFRERSPWALTLLDGEGPAPGPSFSKERGAGRDRPLSWMGGMDPGKNDRPGRSPSPPTPAATGLKSAQSSLSSSPEKLQERSLSEAEEGEDGRSWSPGRATSASLRFFFGDNVEANLVWSSSANLTGSAAFILLLRGDGEGEDGRGKGETFPRDQSDKEPTPRGAS